MTAPLVPLFPLPNVLLYPSAVLPLHVFEPRYVALVEELLGQGQDQLALALLQPGWKELYFEQPPVYPVGGLGRLISTQRAQGGRFNILVEGLGRARLTEQDSDHPFRLVRAELLPEEVITEPEPLRKRLLAALSTWSEEEVEVDASRGLGYLADVLLLTLGVPIEEKQRIFELLDPIERAHAVLRHFDVAAALSRRIGQAGDSTGELSDWN